MTYAIMLQGTASDVGKSVLVAGLCRIFADLGYSCAPFKTQNMALNSGITAQGAEMGRAQIFQAEAARINPDVRMNPVLLKPTSDRRSQVIVMGKVLRDMDAQTYHEFKPQLQQCVFNAFSQLASEHQIIVIEGAGSPAEINLRDRDIVNMGLAEMINAPVILVADIDRGGVFASIYGTLALLSDSERARVKGVIINKFRGDVALLQPGIDQIEALTKVPVLGVVPYLNLDLEQEDGVALQPERMRARQRQAKQSEAETGFESATMLDIAVIKLPHIANFTDFNPLATQPDVNLRYVSSADELGKPDAIIVPGSKNTLFDLNYLNQSGLSAAIGVCAFGKTPVLGICGGYQMLGKQIIDGVESGIERMAGLGLLDCVTQFASRKHTTQIHAVMNGGLGGLYRTQQPIELSGYEIHMGVTTLGEHAQPFASIDMRNDQKVLVADGAVSADGLIAGSYIHGLFDHSEFTRLWLNRLRQSKGLLPLEPDVFDYQQYKQGQFDLLANELRSALSIDAITALMTPFSLKLKTSA
ncbi:adenosylcobyric acid synthase (glutamine-hydrolysing) [Vibrio xiamenensis]|uniref:Cobyric acid synthase n=1 Tax=Vibrio xiamenensis TaxID=861298 RepID=A0A1G8AH09_9VIBR|nr:cobyric acid synthase [Vibrio xiamenensis]SDH20169.1 adenosylcobyric acid synthase (glutamine-hydrolysing) [Vibrio xiamenensis]